MNKILQKLYETFHKDRRLQKRVISDKNFTYRNIVKVLKRYSRKKKKILDIGCGVGTIDFYLAKKGHKVTGIDASENAINIAKLNAKYFGLDRRVRYYFKDFLGMNLLKERYDLVICSEVLEHLHDDKKALLKIFQLLRKGGLVLITVPSKNAPLFKLGLAYEFDKRVGHLRRYKLNEIISLITNNNFKIIRINLAEGLIRNFLFMFKIGNFPIRTANRVPFISDTLTLIDNIFLKLLGESNIIIICKKV